MKDLLPGLKKFSETVYPQQAEMFQDLAKGQNPHTMLITCSDSRIDPSLLIQTKPGELFVLRNAGNIVPPFGASNGGEGAAIEFAIRGLGVKNIVICGHSHCGAMAALSGKADISKLPTTNSWLNHAHATKDRMEELQTQSPEDYIEDNVLVQVQNLKTHPAVSAALASKKIQIFAWVYIFEQGNLLVYSKQQSKYVSLFGLDTEIASQVNNFAL